MIYKILCYTVYKAIAIYFQFACLQLLLENLMAKTVYYGTTMEEARRIIDGDYSMFLDGMMYTQTQHG